MAARRTEAGDGYFLSSICFGGKSIPQRERVLTRLHGRASRGLTRARSARVVPTAHGSLVVTPRVQLKRTRYRENCFIEGKKRFQLRFDAGRARYLRPLRRPHSTFAKFIFERWRANANLWQMLPRLLHPRALHPSPSVAPQDAASTDL